MVIKSRKKSNEPEIFDNLDFFNQKPHYHRLREKSHHKKQVLEDMSITIEEAKPDSMLKITEGMDKTKK